MGGGVMRAMAKAAASVGAYRTGHTPLAREWEDDEVELAGGETLFVKLNLSPPSLEEAKEAAADLKKALSWPYSPHAKTPITGRSAVESSRMPGSSESCSCLEYSDAKTGCAAVLPTSSPTHIIQPPFSLPPSPPSHIVMALALLQDCPDVQNIVASLAADPKIWDAVMTNEKVLNYCAANRICTQQESVNEESEKTDVPSPVDDDDVGDVSPPISELRLIDYMQYALKLKVREMVSSLSDLFESFMGSREVAGSNTSTATIVSTASGSTSNGNSEDMAAGASFVALTIATIILIILKREAT